MGLKRVIPEGMTEDEFIQKRSDEVPNFDWKEHDRLIGKAGSTPMFMSAREILTTHHLLEDTGALFGTPWRNKIIARKTEESIHNLANPRGTEDLGSGRAGGLADSITKNGYDWSKPIPLAVKGVDHSNNAHIQDLQRKMTPVVVNGHHRLAYMWTFHPDEPMPVDIANYNHIFLPKEDQVINNVYFGHDTPEAAISSHKAYLARARRPDDRE
jgi:hypothetical protein